MASFDVDLFVIGGGSGGVRAARVAGALGAKVALADPRPLGGTCVNVGCVPKKLLVYASRFGPASEDAGGLGWRAGRPSHDWRALVRRKDAEIHYLNGVYQRLLDDASVERLTGSARFAEPHVLDVDGRNLSARYIVIATGGWPYLPELPGIEHAITSNEVFHLGELPTRALIIGGGYIAVEFAGIFRGLGTEVAVAHRSDQILRGFDEDVRTMLASELAKRGVDLHAGAEVEAIEKTPAGLEVTLEDGKTYLRDLVLFATGRTPSTAGLGLDIAGVSLGARGEILVNERGQTSAEHIYAVGDVTDRIALTPMALAEGEAVARTLFGGSPVIADHENVPSAVFSQPEVGTVGLTETEARERFERVTVFRSNFRPLQHALTGRNERSMVKVVVDAATDRVLGCHMVGEAAGEVIQGLAVAMRAGLTKTLLDATIGIHPTSAEEFVTLRTPVA